MKRYEIKGFRIPAAPIALGTDGFGVNRSEALAEQLLTAYIEAGGNVLDTARMYGRPENGEYGICESFTGRWIWRNVRREELILSTKGGFPAVDGTPRVNRTCLLSDLSESLDALRTDHIDIYWLHRDDPSRPVEEMAETVQALYESGRVGIVGASNWTAVRIGDVNAYARSHGMKGFMGDQPQWSLARQAYNPDPTLVIMDRELYILHSETGMFCMPFSAQAKGYFAKLLSGGESALSAKAKQRFHVPENIRIAEKLKLLSERTGESPAALSVAWFDHKPFPVIPVVSAGKPEQLIETLAAADSSITNQDADDLRTME